MVQKSSLIQTLEKTRRKVERLLQRNGFKTIILDSERSLRKFIYDTIPDNCIVGLGNSLSSSAMKVREILLEKGNKVYYNWNGTAHNRSLDTFEEQPRPDYFLTLANTITEEGKLLNNEYSGIAVSEYKYPKNIIAFSVLDNLARKTVNDNSDSEYTVLAKKPDESEVTVAFMPFASAS